MNTGTRICGRSSSGAKMKSVEQKYRKLSDIEHVLMRPGMYIGSTKSKKDDVYLRGLTVDYVRQGLNEGFEFRNPNERDRCGCGESFRV